MMNPWPGKWQSKETPEQTTDVSMTNDHGTLYMVGQQADGEWLMMTGDPPDNTC